MLLDLWFHHCLPRPAGSWRGYGFLPEKPRRRPDDDEVLFLCLN